MRIFLIDSQPVFRAGLKSILHGSADMTIAGEADSWRNVPQESRDKFDLIVMDGGVDCLNFLQDLEKSRVKGRPPFTLILSKYMDELEAVQMLAAGANGYVDKSKPAQIILDAIRKVGRGGKYVSQELAETVVFSGKRMDGPARLSRREYQVLCLLASGLGIKEIAAQLTLSSKTVGSYRFRLLEKLNLSNTAQLMRYAIKQEVLND